MAFREIKLQGDKFATYQVSVDLDGQSYTFKITYNSWVHASFLKILDADGDTLVSSIPLAMGVILLDQYSYLETLPPGNLFLYNRNNFDNVARPSGQVVLMYEEVA